MERSALRVVLAAGFVTALFSASTARAQAPAPSDEKCSLSEQQKSGDDCLECRAYYRNNAHCAHALSEYGYAKSCRMRGASMWREVWCRKKDTSARKVPPEILASLDDATAGEPRDASADDAAVLAPTVSDASAIPEASTSADGALPVPPKGQASGCGTCAIGSRGGDGSLAAAAGFAVFGVVAARRRRRTTPSRRDRSRRS